MKELSIILEIPEQCPQDFYKESGKYLGQVKDALETAKSLVHALDDEGRQKAKADAAAIRKYVKTTNGFTKTVYDTMTGKIAAWRDSFRAETKLLEKAADEIIGKFDEMEKKQLEFIETVARAELTIQRTLAELGETFMTPPNLSPIIKLSGTLTPKKKLTSSAAKFISDIVYMEKASEQRFNSRVNEVKIKCLEAGINPPLESDHLGGAMFYDDYEFNKKLQSLVAIEQSRKARADEAREKAAQPIIPQPIIPQPIIPQPIVPQPIAPQPKEKTPGIRTMQYTLVIQAKVKAETSDNEFMSLVKANFSEKLQKSIIHEDLKNVN